MDFNKFKKIMSYCKQYGGATLDGFGRVVKFDSGYQVAYTDHAVKGRKAVRGMLSNIVDTALQSAHYAGLWVENGYTYIDNSVHVDSLDLALSLARKYNQLSIWDWENSKCIYVEAQNE